MPTSEFIAEVYHPRCLLAEACHRRSNRLGISTSHEFANVLLLSAQRAVRLDLTRIQDGFEQVFIEPDLTQLDFPQGNELLTEFLQREELAFQCAFAGL